MEKKKKITKFEKQKYNALTLNRISIVTFFCTGHVYE